MPRRSLWSSTGPSHSRPSQPSEVFLRPLVNHRPSSGMGRWHHKAAARNCPSVRPVPAWNRSVPPGSMRLQ